MKKDMPQMPQPSEQSEGKPIVPRRIDVVAIKLGFFEGGRRAVGSKFSVPSMEKLGSWMKCVDPVLEKRHQEMMKEASLGRVISMNKKDQAGE